MNFLFNFVFNFVLPNKKFGLKIKLVSKHVCFSPQSGLNYICFSPQLRQTSIWTETHLVQSTIWSVAYLDLNTSGLVHNLLDNFFGPKKFFWCFYFFETNERSRQKK